MQTVMTDGLKALLVSFLDERVRPMATMDYRDRQLLPCLTANRLVRIRGCGASLTTEGRDVAECYAGCRRVA